MACSSCGSWSVKADRSLAGRFVCGRCGRPLGLKAEKQVRRRSGGSGRRLPRPRLWWLLGLLALGALLASLEPGRRSPRPLPPSGSQPPGRAL
ncbi:MULTISPECIES: transcriptional regulator [unclassified Cyanobium]|uniref:transcriptional regulator n=1 Tax=unclassified Cyanobium TaxID=2627006 RepID=UPI0016470D95|nr:MULTISPECIES: transcriptional regulator [unclassified Cyanobium]MBE9153436.1 transcriptional regulator [Cyanobium sp. LEGE 06113]QNI70394.1 putative zn-ribbon protein [Cyanobium sp. NS01]